MSKRILMATDVPFWRAGTGAQQRIASIARWMTAGEFELRVLYIGQQPPTANEVAAIEARGLQVEVARSDQAPSQFKHRLKWHWDGLLNQLRSPTPTAASPESLSLADYRWPWAQVAFAEAVDAFAPDILWIEYLTLGYLLDGLRPEQRCGVQCVIDTHDVLHQRAQQFRERGLAHWLEIERHEEATALQSFDLIVAITPAEAQVFAAMAPQANVVVCGHWTPTSKLPESAGNTRATRIGYLGSNNQPNLHGLTEFLEQVWYPGQDSGRFSDAHLVVGGKICQVLPPEVDRNIISLGAVEDLGWFYQRCDFVINPVVFGTGQKIKGIEALAYGKPLVTTEAGAGGLPRESMAVKICAEISDFWEPIELWLDPKPLAAAQSAARTWSEKASRPETVFAELAEALGVSPDLENPAVG